MNPVMKASLLFSVAVVVLSLGASRADAADTIRARVPFPFVVHDKTLPAGQYLLVRPETDPAVVLIEQVGKPHAAAFVVTNGAAGRDPAGDRPCLTFTRVENQYRLSNIWESRTEGRTVVGKK
jgi:hypothetical protein